MHRSSFAVGPAGVFGTGNTQPDAAPRPGRAAARWLLLDIAERAIVPVTALDDQNEELCADSFALEALGRILLEVLRDGDALCPTVDTAVARTVIRFAEKILTEEGQDVADVLAQRRRTGDAGALSTCWCAVT
ncbi:hypothetical protein ACFRCI_49455 [Streptomyces sp. NPDC056638]|uniref:hypothetical protein n=1 Tax=Streptomyces sp. NPDC056638 TaxID=3345887 RepID=UPI0036CE420E